MLRTLSLEFRLATSQHLAVLVLAIGLTALVAWGQEPWFLRDHGIQVLWHGVPAMASVCFLASSVTWQQQLQERITWGHGFCHPTWILGSGLAMLLLATALLLFGILVCATLDLVSGIREPVFLFTVFQLGCWLPVVAPLAFLTPGLAVTPWPAAVRVVLAGATLAASASFHTSGATLDVAPAFDNLQPALIATVGSVLLSATLQRIFMT